MKAWILHEVGKIQLEELEKLPFLAEEVLSNPGLAQKIADRGYAKAKKSHTWKARALELEYDLLEHL